MFITISLYFRHKEMEIHCISSVKINILFINIQGFLLNVLQQLMFYSYSVVIKIKRLDEKECTNRTKWSIYKYNQDFQHAANVNFYNIKVFYDMSWQPECMHAQQNIRKSMPHPLNTVRQEKKNKKTTNTWYDSIIFHQIEVLKSMTIQISPFQNSPGFFLVVHRSINPTKLYCLTISLKGCWLR